MSLSRRGVELRGAKHWPFFKYINALKWESRLTLELNAEKNTDCIEKCFKQKLYKIRIPAKNSVGAFLYFPQ